MRSLRRLLVASVAVLPMLVVAQAQAAARGDLVGTWRATEFHPNGRKVDHILTFQADSTWTLRQRTNDVDEPAPIWWSPAGGAQQNGRWKISGDSLWFSARGSSPKIYRVTFQGEQLILVPAEVSQKAAVFCGRQTFVRIDPSKPLLPVSPPAVAIKRADLAGTWVSTYMSEQRDLTVKPKLVVVPVTIVEKVTLQPDSSWIWETKTTSKENPGFDTISVHRGGTWHLAPGEWLSLRDAQQNVFWLSKIALQDSQLFLKVSCPADPQPYERVRP